MIFYSFHPLATPCRHTWVEKGCGHTLILAHYNIIYRHRIRILSNQFIFIITNFSFLFQDSRRVERKGRLCMFEERRVDASYHIIRSAHNAAWHLDFNPSRRSRKGLAPRRGQKTNQANCHAQFHSGHPRPVPSLADDFSGIFEQIEKTETAFSGILQQLEETETENMYTKAVNNNKNIDVGDNGVKVLSKAHLEALKQQHILSSKKNKYRIRHLMKKNWRVARPKKRSRRRQQLGRV